MPTLLTDADVEQFCPDHFVVVPYLGQTATFRPEEWAGIPDDGKEFAVGAHCTFPRLSIADRRADLGRFEAALIGRA